MKHFTDFISNKILITYPEPSRQRIWTFKVSQGKRKME